MNILIKVIGILVDEYIIRNNDQITILSFASKLYSESSSKGYSGE